MTVCGVRSQRRDERSRPELAQDDRQVRSSQRWALCSLGPIAVANTHHRDACSRLRTSAAHPSLQPPGLPHDWNCSI
ncbi:hypothetical protein K466DRAFT_590212 [Polyporus arcularius HHB13444]|uniref:Uncharacterized protein n=1 Tax=Polyporus arcularius HHB13444 TaxID=1314778 RepID=A0A5C3P019_9APHY|nr:hypothetical protein K466DRAFT_590212 [Polyporus arcularius HHB13444]